MKSKSIISIVIGAVTIGIGALVYFLINRKKTATALNPTLAGAIAETTVSSGGGGGGSPSPYSAFLIKNAWLNGSTYVAYTNTDDAYERNLSDSGFTNRDSQVYATVMANANIAYTDTTATTKYPAGTYYFPAHNLALVVDGNGSMNFVFDEAKPTNLTSHTINISST